MTYSDKDIDYIKGFDHGCDYIVAEIERQIKEANSHDALVLVDLVKRLKMEDKDYLGKVPRK
jgi:hypothetical protein